MARLVNAPCLTSVPAPRRTLVPSYLTWFYAPPMIALQSAWLGSQWLGSLMMMGWVPIWPLAEAGKPRRDSVLKQSHQVIVTPGSNVIRLIPAAHAKSVAPTANTHDGSAEIVAFAGRCGTKRP